MNSKDILCLDAEWKVLESRPLPVQGDFAVLKQNIQTSEGSVYCGIDSVGYRHLFLQVTNEASVIEDKASDGVRVRRHPLVENGKAISCADIICSKKHINQSFARLAEDVVSEVQRKSHSSGKAGHAVLERWREILRAGRTHLIPEQEITGLFGELYYLDKLISINPACTCLWTGPEMHYHDFSGLNVALEIKSSLSRTGRTYKISSISQLFTQPAKKLFFAGVKLEKSVTAGKSLPALIDEIMGKTTDPVLLLEKLEKIGYSVQDAEAYADKLFTVTEDHMYRVDDSFPRIIPSSFIGGAMPGGITRLEYEIDLAGTSPAPISSLEVENTLEDLGKIN